MSKYNVSRFFSFVVGLCVGFLFMFGVYNFAIEVFSIRITGLVFIAIPVLSGFAAKRIYEDWVSK